MIMNDKLKQKLTERFETLSSKVECDNDVKDALLKAYLAGGEYAYELAMQLGWHPASETPAIPEGEDEVEIYCLVHVKGLTVLEPMKFYYTVSHGFGVIKNIKIKWWCYPPLND